ncbi:hypothetical protein KC19_11G145500 [Ceratodon purpureus]|uniref:Alpha-1,3-mannosyl-glycoprotein 2-beta-N-acetylglucosaminyltransferase n=1 Tax=Ceratodon purpureus TaxID=3225 RepID=A0A8T0GHI3_CERPU|nr:hypothetical protein KC19_11G145500 [Ceratodon purpureus]
MVRVECGARVGLVVAALLFLLLQARLFAVQTNYADRIAQAVDGENKCSRSKRALIDQFSAQQGKIVALEDEREKLENKNAQLSVLVGEYRRLGKAAPVLEKQKPVAAVVIMACNRPDYLDRTLKSVLKYQQPIAQKFPLFVSQDGPMESVKAKAKSFVGVEYMQHLEGDPATRNPGEMVAYYKIARHYKFALSELFDVRGFQKVIILEDDMEIAPDFFEYFEATSTVLDCDKSVVAVSSWNDNGQKQFVSDPEALYRSDFFPGLGWMLTREFWDELSPIWPEAYWDDWLRLNSTRKGRQFIRPEVCRTYNFGEHGSSMGQFYYQYLVPIKLNDVLVDWKSKDMDMLSEERFNKELARMIATAMPITNLEADGLQMVESVNQDVSIEYESQSHFERLARKFGVFEEWKDGIPRTSYKGVVVFRWKHKRVFLTRPDSLEALGWKGDLQ